MQPEETTDLGPTTSEEIADLDRVISVESSTVSKSWTWILRWWAYLVTSVTISIPLLLILLGTDVISLPSSVVIAYIAAATGGNTLLAVAGIHILRPFSHI